MTEQPNEAEPHPEQPQSPAPHPQQSYGPGPYPPPPQRSSKDGLMRAAAWGIWTWVAVTVIPLVLVLLCCIGCFGIGVLGSADTEGTAGGESTPVTSGQRPSPGTSSSPSRTPTPSASDKPTEKKAEPKPPGIGDKVRDGKFEFTVTAVKCGVPEVYGSYGSEKAQGRYCLVTLTVRNIGKAAQSFSYSNQKLYVGDVEYSATWDATWRANKDADLLRDEINPGDRLKGVIVAFDVPKGAKPTSVKLHDSLWSGGVTVSLK